HSRMGGGYKIVFTAESKDLLLSVEHSVQCLDTKTGKESHEPIRLPTRAASLAVAGDGRTLAVGLAEHDKQAGVELWDLRTWKSLRQLVGHKKGIAAVAFSPDGKKLASASEDGTVRLWDVETGQVIGAPMVHPGPVRGVAFLENGQI